MFHEKARSLIRVGVVWGGVNTEVNLEGKIQVIPLASSTLTIMFSTMCLSPPLKAEVLPEMKDGSHEGLRIGWDYAWIMNSRVSNWIVGQRSLVTTLISISFMTLTSQDRWIDSLNSTDMSTCWLNIFISEWLFVLCLSFLEAVSCHAFLFITSYYRLRFTYFTYRYFIHIHLQDWEGGTVSK